MDKRAILTVKDETRPVRPMSRRSVVVRFLFIGAFAVAAAFWLAQQPPIHQDLAYHNFADDRTILGVPHFWNVVSNLPFLLLGLYGLWFLATASVGNPDSAFQRTAETWPLIFFFVGAAGTAFGSAYYHLAPDNNRLLWDRLPMAVAFTALVSHILAERVGVRAGVALLLPLVTAGVASVIYWQQTDDLRPYYFVQFFPLAGIPLLLLLFPARYTGSGFLWLALFWYVLAKVCEHPLDRHIFHAGKLLSGHTLKHLLAAVSIYCILKMAMTRRTLGQVPGV
ncbi:MAG: ceramidase [Gemmataceae bacterium]|nr:ceramidase [Gemmataceae bacterium]